MSSIGRIFCLSILSLFFAGAVFAAETAALRAASEVDNPSIRLSDVFYGVPAATDVEIAIAPAPGKSVTYNMKILAGLAEKYGLDWKPTSIADQAVITRASTKITQDMVRSAVLEEISQREEGLRAGGKGEIVFDGRATEISLPADKRPDFSLAKFSYDVISKRFRAELRAETGNSPVVQSISGKVIVKREVPVLSKRMSSGTTVSDSDIDWIWVSSEQLAGDVITDAKDIVGLELRRDKPERQLIRDRDVIQPRLVTRGSLVTLKIKTSSLLITAQGKSLQDGGLGETVRVTNTQSNRIVEGVVEAPGVVRIRTAQKIASAD